MSKYRENSKITPEIAILCWNYLKTITWVTRKKYLPSQTLMIEAYFHLPLKEKVIHQLWLPYYICNMNKLSWRTCSLLIKKCQTKLLSHSQIPLWGQGIRTLFVRHHERTFFAIIWEGHLRIPPCFCCCEIPLDCPILLGHGDPKNLTKSSTQHTW